jgi:predicted Zn-dependent protease
MKPRHRAECRVAAAVLVIAACGEAVAPDRADTYPLDDLAPGLLFHWPPHRLPVRYWVAPEAGPVAGYVATSLATWQNQFLYGEFAGTLVTDSSRADVIVFVAGQTPPDVPLTSDTPVTACEGSTGFDPPDAEGRFPGPFVVTLRWDFRYEDTDVANCLARVALHEVGHSLGIFNHSDEPLDLMHANPTVTAPSVRDRATIEMLYHTPVTVLAPERPR